MRGDIAHNRGGAQAQAGAAVTDAPEAGYDKGPVEILELTDPSLIRGAWETVHPDSTLPDGEYQILIPSGPQSSTGRSPSATVFLLRDGTKVGEIERGAWETLAAISNQQSESWAAVMEGPEKQEASLLWDAIELTPAALLRWAEWPSGFEASMGSVISSVRGSKPQYQRDIDFAWNQKLFSHILLGAQLHRTQYGGGLTRLGARVADTSFNRSPLVESHEFWNDADWWWCVSAGRARPALHVVPGRPAPAPVFLAGARRHPRHPRAQDRRTGEPMERIVHGTGRKPVAYLDARLGILRYGFHWDMDAYTVPVQTVYLDELPAVFGHWGAGLIIASDILATRVWMDIPDISLPIGVPSAYPVAGPHRFPPPRMRLPQPQELQHRRFRSGPDRQPHHEPTRSLA